MQGQGCLVPLDGRFHETHAGPHLTLHMSALLRSILLQFDCEVMWTSRPGPWQSTIQQCLIGE